MRQSLFRIGLLVAAAIAVPGAARAATQSFDLGALNANAPANTCAAGTVCNLGQGSVTFTTGGVSLGATAFIGTGGYASGGYVTQKQGTLSPSTTETGIGQSSTGPGINTLSNPDGEIVTNSYVALRSLTTGWSIAGLLIESMQDFEGAKIYGYNGALTSFTVAGSTLLGTMVGCDGCGASATAARTNAGSANAGTQALVTAGSGLYSAYAPLNSLAAMASFTYLVVTAYKAGTTTPDVAISAVTLASAGGDVVTTPEPASMAMLGFGIAGLAGARRRKAGRG